MLQYVILCHIYKEIEGNTRICKISFENVVEYVYNRDCILGFKPFYV